MNAQISNFGFKNCNQIYTILFMIILHLIAFPTWSYSQDRSNTSKLFGKIYSADDCSPEHQAFNDKIMMFGRIAVSTVAFEECVTKKVTNLYRKCNGDPFYNENLNIQIQKVLDISRRLQNVHIKCTGGIGNASTGIEDYGELTDVAFSWSGWFQSAYKQIGKKVCNKNKGERPWIDDCRWADYPWPYSQAAGIAWHEIMHQNGYVHGANDQKNAIINCGYKGDPSWNFQKNTMPYIIEHCVNDIITQSGKNCNLDSCLGSNQLQMITSYNGTQCKCVNDPSKKGIGILKIENGGLIDEAIKPIDDWIGEWRLGIKNNLIAFGDFNGDNIDDFIVTSDWGIGLLTHDGNIWRPLAVKANGTGFGGWNFQSASDQIQGVGDFNKDGKDDFIVTSGWGISILTLDGNSSLNSLMIKPNGTDFGGWKFQSADNQIQGIGDFNNDGKDDFIVTSGWGIAILTLDGNNLNTLMIKPNGTGFGGWNFQSTNDQIQGVGDFNNDGRDDFIVTSGWGIAILTLDGNNLNSLMIKPNGTDFGSWKFQSADNQIQGIGDFNNDGKDDFVVTSGWGIGILELSGNILSALVVKPNGTEFGGWNFQSADNHIKGIGDFNGDGNDDLVISSDWGLGILTKSGNSLTDLDMKPYGKLFGSWVLENTDNVGLIGKFGSGSNSKLLIQKRN